MWLLVKNYLSLAHIYYTVHKIVKVFAHTLLKHLHNIEHAYVKLAVNMHGDATSFNTSGSDTQRNAEESLFVNSMHPLELHDPLEN